MQVGSRLTLNVWVTPMRKLPLNCLAVPRSRAGRRRSRRAPLHLAEQLFACLGDDDALSDAVEQPMADLGLELLDLVRQGGLGDVDGLRRAGKIQLLGQRREIAQMTQFHG